MWTTSRDRYDSDQKAAFKRFYSSRSPRSDTAVFAQEAATQRLADELLMLT